jgi:hypothetical protein
MNEADRQPPPHEIDAAIRERILARAKAVNGKLLSRFATVVANLNEGHHREALVVLDDIEAAIAKVRIILSLLELE